MLKWLQPCLGLGDLLSQGNLSFQELSRTPSVHLECTSLIKEVRDSQALVWDSPGTV